MWHAFGVRTLSLMRLLGGLADSLAAALIVPLMVDRRSATALLGASQGGWGIVPGLFSGIVYAALSTTALVATLGLETGFYTLSVVVCFLCLRRGWNFAAAIVAAFHMLVHPDGVLLAAVVLITIALWSRSIPIVETLVVLLAGGVYLGCSKLYFGQFVPQTMVAKSAVYQGSLLHSWWLPLGKFFLGSPGAWALGIFAVTGAIVALRSRSEQLPLLAWGALYIAAFSTAGVWWPWYFAAPTIAYTVAAGIGLRSVWAYCLKRVPKRVCLCAAIGWLLLTTGVLVVRDLRYVRFWRVSEDVGCRQKKDIAAAINARTSSNALVMLEPLGMIGFFANRNFADYPGLASRKVTDATRELGRKIPAKPSEPQSFGHVLRRVAPDALVLREDEYVPNLVAGTLRRYIVSKVFPVDPRLTARYPSLQTMYLLVQGQPNSRSGY
jgi:hypothetical protein